jgi:hypothetical protein
MPGLALETSAPDADGVTTVRIKLAFPAPRIGIAVLFVDGRELARLAVAAGDLEVTTQIAVEGTLVLVPAWGDEPEPTTAPPAPAPSESPLPRPPVPQPEPPPPPIAQIVDSIAPAVGGY